MSVFRNREPGPFSAGEKVGRQERPRRKTAQLKLRAAYSTRMHFIDERYEAASGDLHEDGTEPTFVFRRGTNDNVIKLLLRVDQGRRVMTATYEIVDDEVQEDDVIPLFCQTYFVTLTDHYWREHIDTVVFSRPGAPPREINYPR